MKTLGFQSFLFVRGKPRGIRPKEIKSFKKALMKIS